VIIIFILFLSFIAFSYEPGGIYTVKFKKKGNYEIVLKSKDKKYRFLCRGKLCFWGIPLELNGKSATLILKENKRTLFKKRIKVPRKKFKVYTLRFGKGSLLLNW